VSLEKTLADVKRVMAHRDNLAAQKSLEAYRGKEETANSFIILGFELEAIQYVTLPSTSCVHANLVWLQAEHRSISRTLFNNSP
jgi:hypothetical protein